MATKKPAQQEAVTLAAPYAFYDDEGVSQSWSAGQVVEDSAVVALLVARGAPLIEAS